MEKDFHNTTPERERETNTVRNLTTVTVVVTLQEVVADTEVDRVLTVQEVVADTEADRVLTVAEHSVAQDRAIDTQVSTDARTATEDINRTTIARLKKKIVTAAVCVVTCSIVARNKENQSRR